MLGLLATAAAGGTYAEVHYAGRIHLDRPSVDGVSQDSVGIGNAVTAPGVGGAGQAQFDDILPDAVSYPATVTSPHGYKGSRYAGAARAGDCGVVFDALAPTTVTTGCAGYLMADYVRQSDHALYSSVTVLYYPNPASAAKAAKILKASQNALTYLVFRQPGGGLAVTASQSTGSTLGGGTGALASAGALPNLGGPPLGKTTGGPIGNTPPSGTATGTPTAAPTGSSTATPASTVTPTPSGSATPPEVTHDPVDAATEVRVAAVGSTVAIVQSAFADGRPASAELDTPTWYLSYTVASALAWEPDQPPAAAATPPTP